MLGAQLVDRPSGVEDVVLFYGGRTDTQIPLSRGLTWGGVLRNLVELRSRGVPPLDDDESDECIAKAGIPQVVDCPK